MYRVDIHFLPNGKKLEDCESNYERAKLFIVLQGIISQIDDHIGKMRKIRSPSEAFNSLASLRWLSAHFIGPFLRKFLNKIISNQMLSWRTFCDLTVQKVSKNCQIGTVRTREIETTFSKTCVWFLIKKP